MFRRTWRRLISLAEAQRLVADVSRQPTSPSTATATLPAVLSALKEHYRQGDEAFTKAALQCIVQLDQSNADTQYVADMCVSESAASTPVIGARANADQPVASRHLITELLRVYPHSPEIRERCCRCIANICQLGADSQDSHGGAAALVSAPPFRNDATPPSLADALVGEGALELILSTLAMAGRLSPRGRCWAAMAMLNITCMSHSGAARATKADAVDRLAEYILFLLDEAASTTAAGVSPSIDPMRGLSEDTATALDAALGALAAVLAAEAPENSSGISFNYEAVSYTAVDAVVRALLYVSALLVRDGRNDGAYGASLPARRYGTLLFPTASATQQTAIVVLLPLLHKAWMSLQEVSSCPTNLPMVFDVIYEAANANQESMILENESAAGGSEEVLEVTAQTERQYVAALSNLVEAALFLTTEVEGLDAIGADELARLQRDVRLNVMDTMQSMTASRKDVARRSATAAEQLHGSSDACTHDGEDDAVEAAGVYPTAAAMSVTDVLASGTVSNMALACAVRLLTEHQEQASKARTSRRGAAVAAPYSTHNFTLLSKSLVVLANVAEVGDEVATSANAVAALQAILVDAVEEVLALPQAYKADLAELFKPTENDEHTAAASARASSSSSSSSPPGAIHEEDRLAFLQQAALVGQVYAVLWSTLRTAQGVTTVSQLRVLQTAKAVQTSLRESYLPAIEAAKARYGKHAAPASDRSQLENAVANEAWVPNTAEETVVRLLKLSDELIDNLSKLSDTSESSASCAN